MSALVLAATLVLAVPALASATDWTQFRGDIGQSGTNPAETTLTPSTVGGLQQSWRRSVGSHVLWDAPLVVGDETIVSAIPSTVAAFSTSTGQRLWTFHLKDAYLGNAIAVGGGRVFVDSLEGPVFALDAATGAMLWRLPADGLGDGNLRGGPAVDGDVVFVPHNNRLYALDAATGVTLWRTSQDYGLGSTPSISRGLVVVATSGCVFAFDETSGALAWSYFFPRATTPGGASIVDGAVFAADGRAEVKLDLASGQVIWRKTLPLGNAANSTPAVGEGIVVLHVDRIHGARDILTARSLTTGNVVWSVDYKHGRSYGLGSSAAIVGGVVYAGFSDHQVRAFDASDGTLLWQAQLDGESFSSPSIANGQLEIGTYAGSLYAFRLP